MELWLEEHHTADVSFRLRVREQLYTHRSDFQKIDVYDSYEFGRVLVLDNAIMLTEKDEFIYHEMIVHPAMAVHPAVRRALIIGGGDGGALRELARYDAVEAIDLVEIDALVIEACRRHMPSVASAFDDPRLTVVDEDGLRFVRHVAQPYDLIIVDSTDPFGPGESLFSREFYGNCYEALADDGILINQHESPYYREDALEAYASYAKTSRIFPIAKVYQAHIPTYPSGHWLFGFLSKRYDPLRDLDALRWHALGLDTRYYNTDLHEGAFRLPTYVRRLLETGALI